jgi:hypothetical protein
VNRSAVFSDDRLCRFELRRVWDEDKPLAAWLMQNPSKAGAEEDDPSVLRVVHFSRLLGAGGAIVVNWTPWVATDPGEMVEAMRLGKVDSFLSRNIGFVAAAAEEATWRVVAFGVPPMSLGFHVSRALNVFRGGREVLCIGSTGGGHPLHPMARGRWRALNETIPYPWRGS